MSATYSQSPIPEPIQMQSAENWASADGTPDALRNATERDFSPAA